jgi:hypothetical protein
MKIIIHFIIQGAEEIIRIELVKTLVRKLETEDDDTKVFVKIFF